MSAFAECADGEDIVKGILFTDIQKGKIRPSLLEGEESSYSRLAIYSLKKILRIFRRDLPQPPEKLLVGYLIFNVGKMKDVARAFRSKEVKSGYLLKVEPVPISGLFGNRAHAETRPNVTLGLAKALLRDAMKKDCRFSPQPAEHDYLARFIIFCSRRFRRRFS
jgi:hypothetical protein